MACWNNSSELKKHVLSSLNRIGTKPSYRKGQNFLINASIIHYQINEANIQPSDTILEIGSGLGNLTFCLAKLAKKVYAIEADRILADFLNETAQSYSNIEVITGDAVKIKFPKFNKCVSNLPYQISSPITFKLLNHSFDLAILMYQKEFAQRLFAAPGTSNYSRITVMMNLKASCKYLKTVKPSSYYPPPKVYSSIVSICKKDETLVQNHKDFGLLVTLLFTNKKKIVRNVFANLLKRKAKQKLYPNSDILESLPYAERRIFTLTLEELAYLFQKIRNGIGEKMWSDIISLNTK
ncbi:MAG: ribosomal RNA small subunit methyltransferase A [Candidatus Heimdallarchaeota archaeon]|nr:ribosomal RNA small subunit methyltransferase A [Candidatus Heimdallarchaeota archaeon]MCK4953907.1 ribosomal RNA small subunit methyltransferase A [Candidatus Heimdallarchaeota archaeon]